MVFLAVLIFSRVGMTKAPVFPVPFWKEKHPTQCQPGKAPTRAVAAAIRLTLALARMSRPVHAIGTVQQSVRAIELKLSIVPGHQHGDSLASS